MRFLILILIPLLTGCTLFEGMGGDSSKLSVANDCKVSLKQAARVSGFDDTDVIENVTVDPDCTTRIEFRQVTGDSIMKIEGQGGIDILEHGSAVETPPVVPDVPMELLEGMDDAPID